VTFLLRKAKGGPGRKKKGGESKKANCPRETREGGGKDYLSDRWPKKKKSWRLGGEVRVSLAGAGEKENKASPKL